MSNFSHSRALVVLACSPVLLLGAFGALGPFGAAAAIGVALLAGVVARSRRLAAANAELTEANAELALANEALAQAGAVLAARNRGHRDATDAKSRFVASLSHELRTPLHAVIGFAELLHAGRGGPLSERQREYLQIIRDSSDHLLALADDALDLSAVEAGHIRLQPRLVDPAAIASECVSAVRAIAAERRVTLSLDSSVAGHARLDPARLRQVILNYASNAIRFTPAGGRVTVRLSAGGDGLLVEVVDTGIGISAADQAHVFDAFVRVGRSRRDGSGLGLAVTRQIVEAQGGAVSVSSRPGGGSTFSAWLPTEIDAPSAPARMQAPDLLGAVPAITLREARRRPRRAPGARAAASR